MKKIKKFITTFAIALGAATLVVLIYTKINGPQQQQVLIREKTPVQLAKPGCGFVKAGSVTRFNMGSRKKCTCGGSYTG